MGLLNLDLLALIRARGIYQDQSRKDGTSKTFSQRQKYSVYKIKLSQFMCIFSSLILTEQCVFERNYVSFGL